MTLAITSLLTFAAGVAIGHMVGTDDLGTWQAEAYRLRHRLYLAGGDPEWAGRGTHPRHRPPPSGSRVRRAA